MHAVHTTPGFVIGSKPYGEADRLLYIFTRDLGLVTAVAQSIRLERSKLRYSAQDYDFGNFSLVRGRELWRLTSAQASRPMGDLTTVARIALLLRRFLHGEEANQELFDCVRAFIESEAHEALEHLTVFRVMSALGYIAHDSETGMFVGDAIDKEVLDEALARKTALVRHINRALKESHL